MNAYDDALSLGAARAQYFARSGFDESSYTARWVRLQAGPLSLRLPNTASRVRAVRLHDLHHVLTGYDTSWKGEAEIGAWELASGCADHFAAWFLNFSAMGIGLVIAPRAVFAALLRGRHTRNLYREEFREALLAEPVGAMRRRLGLDAPVPLPGAADRMAMAGWAAAALVIWMGNALPLVAVLWLAIALLG